MSAMMDVLQFESQNKEFLENLAVELVKKEMAIPENALQFDAKLVPIGAIGDEGFQKQSENPSDEEIEQQFGVDSDEAGEDLQQFVNAFDTFNDEVAI
jgi:GTP-dependent phosphoenolpyruvate carboxykinase